jgi:hypothetical protein
MRVIIVGVGMCMRERERALGGSKVGVGAWASE